MSMEQGGVRVRTYEPEDPRLRADRAEIRRYAGMARGGTAEDAGTESLLAEVMEEMKGAFAYRVCYLRTGIAWDGEKPLLPFGSESRQLAGCLRGSRETVVFAATAGMEADRRIARYQRISPTKALLAQAYGAERAERLCDVFCAEIAEEAAAEGLRCTPRFSPGYGDLPLETQRDVFRLLDCERKIGVWLNESLLMTPSKSVTAVFGLLEERG